MKKFLEVLKGLWAKRSFRIALALLLLAAMLVSNLGSALRSMTDVHHLYADEGDEEIDNDSSDDDEDSSDGDEDSGEDESGDQDESDAGDSSDDGDTSDYSDSSENSESSESSESPESSESESGEAGESADPGSSDAVDPASGEVTDPAAGEQPGDIAPAAGEAAAMDIAQGDSDDNGLDDGIADTDPAGGSESTAVLPGAGEAGAGFDSDAEMEEARAEDTVKEQVASVEEEVIKEEEEEKAKDKDYDAEAEEEALEIMLAEEGDDVGAIDIDRTPVSFSEIKSAIAKTGGYSYFAEDISITGHTEGTVAGNTVDLNHLAGLWMSAGEQGITCPTDEDGNAKRRNYLMGNCITVKETVTDKDGNPVEGQALRFSIKSTDGRVSMQSDGRVTNAKGIASTAFFVPTGSYNVYVQYGTATKNPWGGTEFRWDEDHIYDYTSKATADGSSIRFLTSGAIDVYCEYGDNINYVHNSITNHGYSFNNPGAIIVGTPAAYNDAKALAADPNNRGKVSDIYKAYEGEYGYSTMDISSILDDLSAFSARLADSASSSDVEVVNLTAEEANALDNVTRKGKLSMNGKEFMVINIDMTGYSGCPNTSNVWNDKVSHWESCYDYGDGCEWGGRQLLNFFTRDEDGKAIPYNGTLSGLSQAMGVVLAPDAIAQQNTFQVAGSIIARKIPGAGGSELHANSFLANAGKGQAVVEIVTTEEEEKPEETRDILVKKLDDEDNPVDGAEFELYTDPDCTDRVSFTMNGSSYVYSAEATDVYTLTTSDGVLRIQKVPHGMYYLKETVLPVDPDEIYTYGYLNGDPVTSITVGAGEDAVNVKVINPKTKVVGSLTVAKKVTAVDSNGKTGEITTSDRFFFRLKSEKTGAYVRKDDGDGSSSDVFAITAGGSVTIDDLVPGKYQVIEVDEKGNSLDDYFPYQVSYHPEGGIVNVQQSDTMAKVSIENQLTRGTITLNKTGSDGLPVNGAEFELYQGEKYFDTYTTGKDGTFTVKDLPFGEYWFKEVSVPEDYMMPEGKDAETEHVKLNRSKPSCTIDVKNEKFSGKVIVHKVSREGDTVKPLAGAKFVLKRVFGDDRLSVGLVKTGDCAYSYSKDGKEDLEMDTTNGGILTIDALPAGLYMLEETVAPKGYKPVDTGFEIKKGDEAHPVVNVDVENSLVKAALEFTKVDDSKNHYPVEDAVFEIRRITGDTTYDVVATVKSGSDGKVTYNNLTVGNYYVIETSAPAGYVVSDKEYHFTVDTDKNSSLITIGETIGDKEGCIVNNRNLGSLKLRKVDGDSKDSDGIEDVEFTLYQESDTFLKVFGLKKKVATFTTDANGSAVVKDLDWGDYILKETGVPEGFEAPEEDIRFTIDGQHIVADFTNTGVEGPVKNYHKRGDVSLTKVDAKDKSAKLNGAMFNLYRADSEDESKPDMGACIAEGLETKDGVVSVASLPYGTYYFVEKKAPALYDLDEDNAYKVIAGGKAKESSITVTNKKKTGKVRISKVDEEGKPLSGAEFTIYNKALPEDATLLQKIASFIFDDGSVLYDRDRKVSGEDGIVEFEGLEYGEYAVSETVVPDGMEKTADSYFEFEISDENVETIIERTVRNTLKTEIKKEDSSSSEEKKEDSSSSEEEKKEETSSSEEEKKEETSSSVEEKKEETSSSEEKKEETSSSEEEKKEETSSSEEEKKEETSSSEEKKEETSSSAEAKKEEASSSATEDVKPVTKSSSEVKKTETSSSEEKKAETSSSEVKKVETSSSSKTEDEKPVTKSSSAKTEDEKPVTRSSSETKKAETSSSETKKAETSSSEVKKAETSSSAKAEDEKPAAKSSSEAKKVETSSSETKKVETSSSETKKAETSSSEAKKVETSSSETKKAETSSSETKKAESSSSEVKKAETSSSETKKEETSSSEEKKEDTSSSEEKKDDSSSSDQEDKTVTSSSSKDDDETFGKKGDSSSSEALDKSRNSSSFKDDDESAGKKSSSSSSKKKKKKKSTRDHSEGGKHSRDEGGSDGGSSGGSDGGSSGGSEDRSTGTAEKKGGVLNAIAGVLGVTAAPEVTAGVLGEIAAPLTGDDLNPMFWLLLAGIALASLVSMLILGRKLRK